MSKREKERKTNKVGELEGWVRKRERKEKSDRERERESERERKRERECVSVRYHW